MVKALMLTQSQVVMTASAPCENRRNKGSRLIMNASFTPVLGCFRAQLGWGGVGEKVVSTGRVSNAKMRRREVDITSEVL